MQIQIICTIVLAIGLQHCTKTKKCQYTSPPLSFFFLIKQGGNRLPDSVLDNTRIFYFENGIKKQLSDLVRATEEGRELGVLTTRLIGLLSADQNIKTFIIEYPVDPADTLYVDYVSPTPANNCLYSNNLVRFNNQVATPDPAITAQRVYVFNK